MTLIQSTSKALTRKISQGVLVLSFVEENEKLAISSDFLARNSNIQTRFSRNNPYN